MPEQLLQAPAGAAQVPQQARPATSAQVPPQARPATSANDPRDLPHLIQDVAQVEVEEQEVAGQEQPGSRLTRMRRMGSRFRLRRFRSVFPSVLLLHQLRIRSSLKLRRPWSRMKLRSL